MRATAYVTVGVIAVATLQALVARWVTPSAAAPIIPALLTALIDVLQPRALSRTVLMGAAAAELGSGLPLGAVSLSLIAGWWFVRALLRHMRIAHAVIAKVVGGIFLVLTLQSVLLVFATDAPLPRGAFLLSLVGWRILLPAGIAGVLTASMSQFLVWAQGRRALRLYGL